MCIGASSLYRIQPGDDNPDLFGQKIVRYLTSAFLMYTALTVSTPDVPNSDDESDYDVGGHRE